MVQELYDKIEKIIKKMVDQFGVSKEGVSTNNKLTTEIKALLKRDELETKI